MPSTPDNVQDVTTWRCSVCGYLHEGPEPPPFCPLCGAPPSAFERVETASTKNESEQKSTIWQCSICGYAHEGTEAPTVCPVCAAETARFTAVQTPKPAQPDGGKGQDILIVGGGIAGLAAAEAARNAAPHASVTLVSMEEPLPYYRLNLTRYLAGDLPAKALSIHPETWYAGKNIRLLRDTRVTSLSPDNHTLTLERGESIRYDNLVLCTGAHPFIPPFPGTDKLGATALRTIADADFILEQVKRGGQCVCIGGGLLGLETAAAIAKQGGHVTVLENQAWLMPRQLNRRAAQLLAEHLSQLGVQLKTNATTAAITGSDRVEAVALLNDEQLDANLAVITTGIRANTQLAQEANLATDRGIRVDDQLTTSAPNLFAAGDNAEHNGVLYGIWAPAQYQGTIAGMNAAGATVGFGALPRSNVLKVLGLDLMSIGRFEPEDRTDTVVDHETDSDYAHFVFSHDTLVGAILLGAATIAAAVKNAVEQRTNLSTLLDTNPNGPDVMTYFQEQSYK